MNLQRFPELEFSLVGTPALFCTKKFLHGFLGQEIGLNLLFDGLTSFRADREKETKPLVLVLAGEQYTDSYCFVCRIADRYFVKVHQVTVKQSSPKPLERQLFLQERFSK